MNPLRHRLALAASLLSSVGIGCTPQSSPERESAEVRVHKVVVTKPRPETYTHDMTLPATLEPFETAKIYGQVAGYLDAVEVDLGTEVKAGDVIARIFAPEVGAEVQRAQANVLATRTQIKQLEEAKQLAALERERRENLRQAERGAISQQDVDTAIAGAEMASAEVEAAEAAVRRAEAELTRLRARKSFAVVRAPFGGRITRRYLHPGAMVRETSSSGAEPIVELTRINPLRVVFEIPEAVVPHAQVGHDIAVTYDLFPTRRDQTTITRVAGALNPQTRAMRAEADLLNETGELPPGAYAKVHLTAVAIPDALVLPSRAVRGTGDERHVLVVQDGVLERRDVTVVTDDGKHAVIAKGVSADDAVLLAGSPLATQGAQVEVAEVRE